MPPPALRTLLRPATTSSTLLRTMATTSIPSSAELKIQSGPLNTAPGVSLSEHQTTLLGSVLDLFAGKPSLAKLRLWSDAATFADPLTIAEGRKQYAAQWYGLQTAFSRIEQLHHEVTDAGNPMLLSLRSKYTLKGVGMEKEIDSVVRVHVDAASGLIDKVEDRWNNELPEGAFAKALRELNAKTVPALVKVPQSEEEERAMGN